MREELPACLRNSRQRVRRKHPKAIILAGALPSLLLVALYGSITRGGDSPTVQGKSTTASPENEPKERTEMEKDYLSLARLFADAGKTDDALKAYDKAMESHDPKIRAAALAEARVLLSERNRFRSWLIAQVKAMGKGTLLIISVVLLWIIASLVGTVVYWIKCACHMGRIDVQPFGFSPSSNSTYDHFREVLAVMREKIQRQQYLTQHIAVLQAATVVPTIQSGVFIERLEAPIAAVAPTASVVLSWLLRTVNRPRFTIEGSVSIDDRTYNVVVNLLRGSGVKRTWERNMEKSQLVEGLKDIAYEILVSINMGSH